MKISSWCDAFSLFCLRSRSIVLVPPSNSRQKFSPFLSAILIVTSLIICHQQIFLLRLTERFACIPDLLLIAVSIPANDNHLFSLPQDLLRQPNLATFKSVSVHFVSQWKAFKPSHNLTRNHEGVSAQVVIREKIETHFPYAIFPSIEDPKDGSFPENLPFMQTIVTEQDVPNITPR